MVVIGINTPALEDFVYGYEIKAAFKNYEAERINAFDVIWSGNGNFDWSPGSADVSS
jgi:hypothetical protein